MVLRPRVPIHDLYPFDGAGGRSHSVADVGALKGRPRRARTTPGAPALRPAVTSVLVPMSTATTVRVVSHTPVPRAIATWSAPT